MATVTSILEHEYFLEFPKIIRKKMNIKTGDTFYAYRDISYTLILSRIQPAKSKYHNMVKFHVERDAEGIVLQCTTVLAVGAWSARPFAQILIYTGGLTPPLRKYRMLYRVARAKPLRRMCGMCGKPSPYEH